MSILTFVSPGETELNTDILNQPEISPRTRRRVEKIGARVLKHAAKGEVNISAAPNWFDAWKQNTVLEHEDAKLVEEVLAVNGLAARVERTHHFDIPEDRVVIVPERELAVQHMVEQAQELPQVEPSQEDHHLAA